MCCSSLRIRLQQGLLVKRLFPSTVSMREYTLFSFTGATITSSLEFLFTFLFLSRPLPWVTKYSPSVPLCNVTCQSFNLRSENHPNTFKSSYLERCLYLGPGVIFHFYLWSWLFSISLPCPYQFFCYYSFLFGILFHNGVLILVYIYGHSGLYVLPCLQFHVGWLQLLTSKQKLTVFCHLQEQYC